MKRFFALPLLGVVALTVAIPSLAQQTPRVGFLYFGSRGSAMATGRYDAFVKGMREQGYVAGKNFTMEERFAGGNMDALAAAANELVRLRVEVIVATGNPAVQAARKATKEIPIVVTATADPVREGFAASLERPGSNITGLYTSAAELVTKQLELVRLQLPKLSRIALLTNPASTSHPRIVKNVEAWGAQNRVAVHSYPVTNQADIESAFAGMARERTQALLVCADTFFLQQATQISQLALKQRLPTIAWTKPFTQAGALMSYGQDSNDNFRLAAGYVDKLFKGAKAAELPFARTPKVSLTVNRTTFRALGLTVSKEIESRVDEVIE